MPADLTIVDGFYNQIKDWTDEQQGAINPDDIDESFYLSAIARVMDLVVDPDGLSSTEQQEMMILNDMIARYEWVIYGDHSTNYNDN
ncbi:MAG: hypothetical protein EBU90_27015 [Proteobacteria bacterium]|nr:hypothetical protein [Pseudomonadota bacterium]